MKKTIAFLICLVLISTLVAAVEVIVVVPLLGNVSTEQVTSV